MVKTENPNKNQKCRKCKKTGVHFSPCRIKTRNWICVKCNNTIANSDPARRLARKLANSLKHKGGSKPYPGTELVRKILKKCDNKSVLNGETNLKKLCVIRMDDAKPWTEENAVIVTSSESHAITRGGNKIKKLIFDDYIKNQNPEIIIIEPEIIIIKDE